MKIGFDISQTGSEKAGCGFFADSLIRHLAEIDRENEYILYPTFGNHYMDPHWASSTCRIAQPNFSRGYTGPAPDIGAHQRGEPPLRYGVGARQP